ncbi:putative iron-regulated protein [Vibrio crassostreae]|uniref:imelysin family protein n=1 Tax=Vibrio crassostreae TaxID=246167 RepID=UPI0005E42F0F|nr:imelysin family protein [Vibrio crassostreae]RPF16818.1 putative iron-regulated protein [Vibrio crassostreae]TCN89690.1 putative iron-regulated protein [Vibrio crassostreae]TCT63394.1 putative iron-regulated protein [Vibrio crassostreae]TCT84125.1 putative iron-regulated protein [Vibrio crassostreae]TCU04665.1 putative iron-regulated protein [Vibrio crassostreae]
MTIKSLVTKVVTSSLIFASASSFAAVTQDQVVEHYADIAHAVFADSVITAKALNSSIDTFLASPSASNFEQVKQAWLESRVPYQQSEVFRFGNVVVDDWEGQLNAWPLDEGLIDYVSSDYQYELGNEGASANIVANKTFQIGQTTVDATNITPELIADLNEIGGSEANVASGYHAIEFLLWGQDLNGTNSGAGERAYTDFVVGAECTNGNCDRRGAYLKASAELLIQDLEWMEKQWAEGEKGNYRQELLSESSDNGLRKMLFGMGSLSLGELAGERMKVALEANSTEDEHDCFSDNTHNSHYYNEQGIYNVYTGLYKREDGTLLSGPSLFDLVEQKDEQAAKEIQKQFDLARAQVGQLVTSAEKNNQHFDQLIAADNAAGNALVNKTIVALVSQTAAIERAAGVIGIDSLNPDTADHEF